MTRRYEIMSYMQKEGQTFENWLAKMRNHREDSGMFQCSASNEAGYITGYTWLRVKSKFPRFLFQKRVENAQWQRLEERLERAPG